MGWMFMDGISGMSMYVIAGASLLLLSFGIWHQQGSLHYMVQGERQACGVVFPSRSGRWKRYTLNPLGYKWDHVNLTYRIVQYPSTLNRGDTDKAFEIAFGMWSKVSPLTFKHVLPKHKSDLSIGFYSFNHSDCWESPLHPCFDGLNGELAHAFLPPRGEIHFDNHEFWVLGPSRFSWNQGVWYNDLVQVAAHEIGHALGLWHSRDVLALMHPNATYTRTRRLARDDILAIQHLYGCPTSSSSSCEALKGQQSCGLQRCSQKCNGCKEVFEEGPKSHKVTVKTFYAAKGKKVTLNCTHSALQPHRRVSWYKDGSRLNLSAPGIAKKSASSLIIQARVFTQGRYTCVIRQGIVTLGGKSWNLLIF
ncbi:matrix metalloproteinase-23-like [Hyla sarda]|uniref:matrix metalloproteinase-23-like n=1 Tax=Hyla sarda TaxID=327740 RepID=UPI0024C25C51|nr:matrix metalloproteinase-23-like [Hyla sarda]